MSLLLAALLMSVDPSSAPGATAPQSGSVDAPTKPKKEKKICKADPAETGSHMVKRICLTQEQWDAQQGRSVDQMGTIPTAHQP